MERLNGNLLKIALQKKGQLFVFIFSCILSASKWAKYDMVSISPWCWCNPADASRTVYIGTSFAFFYGPVGVGVLLNAYLTISALQIVRHMKVNDSIKRRFKYLLGYPVVLTCWAACSWISFITSSSSTTLFGPITLIFESFWIIWYPIIFFLVFRSARRAWGVYFAELWATKNFMAASSASHNWVNDMAKATEMGIQQGMEEAGASAKPISRSMSPRHMSDIPDIMNEFAMVDGDMNVQIQVESPMQEMNQRRTIDGNRSTLDRQTIVSVQEDVSRGKDDRRGRNVNVIEVQILQNS